MSGFTSAERYLNTLAKRSFLSLWSYSNLFRDQFDSKSKNTVGKEICDLIVVFGRHVLLFSDKDCSYPEHSDEKVAWRRWFKKAVLGSSKQLFGAQRWLQDHPERVFLDDSCTVQLPIPLPADAIYHRIAVVHSISEPCKTYFKGGSGSLVYNSEIIGEDHIGDDCEPFAIGRIEDGKGYVHVLDDNTLDILMRELDTITDFIGYLTKKEELIKKVKIIAAGEEELLANYMSRVDQSGQHNFDFGGNYTGVFVEDGHWHSYIENPQTLRKKSADRESYTWDNLIEEFALHALQGTQHFSSHPGLEGAERGLRVMAQLSRFERRIASKHLREFIIKNSNEKTKKASRVFIPENDSGTGFVFMMLHPNNAPNYEDYRRLRLALLEVYCSAMKITYPHLIDIVGLGFGVDSEGGGSEDLLYLDGREWDSSLNAAIQEDMRRLDIFQTQPQHRMQRFHAVEYPDTPKPGKRIKGREANSRCPCGSGKKYKKCCGVR